MGKLSNDEFLQRIEQLLLESKSTGSIYLTQKRYAPKDEVTGERTISNSLIFRATDGKSDKRKRIKFSTVVKSEDVGDFFVKYTEVVKSGVTGLRKKDKKKNKKQAAKK